MTGFKDETQLWNYQKPRLLGRWDRYELIFPVGHPDVKGSFKKRVRYIENKVGLPSINRLEPSQVDYVKWLLGCDQEVWLCFGATDTKRVLFFMLFVAESRLWMSAATPDFWLASATPAPRRPLDTILA